MKWVSIRCFAPSKYYRNCRGERAVATWGHHWPRSPLIVEITFLTRPRIDICYTSAYQELKPYYWCGDHLRDLFFFFLMEKHDPDDLRFRVSLLHHLFITFSRTGTSNTIIIGNAGAAGVNVTAKIPAVTTIWRSVYMWIPRYLLTPSGSGGSSLDGLCSDMSASRQEEDLRETYVSIWRNRNKIGFTLKLCSPIYRNNPASTLVGVSPNTCINGGLTNARIPTAWRRWLQRCS